MWAYQHNPTGKSLRNYCEDFTADVSSGYKYAALVQNDLLYIFLFTDFAHWKTN